MVDHLIYAAPELETAVTDIAERFGVGAAGGGQHIGLGTHNRLLSLGPRTYLEIIAPDPAQPEPATPRPFGVDGVTRSGLVGWALECDDIDAAVRDARSRGFDPGDVMEGRRATPTGELLRWRLTRNAMTAGVVPFLISWGETPHPASTAPQGLTLTSVHVESPDPTPVREALQALGASVEVRTGTTAALVARISGPNGDLELR